MLPINLDSNKYQMLERCTFFIWSEFKCEPHENIVCVLPTWTILQMEMDRNFKKKIVGVGKGVFLSSHRGELAAVIPPTSLLCHQPHANHVHRKAEGVYD